MRRLSWGVGVAVLAVACQTNDVYRLDFGGPETGDGLTQEAGDLPGEGEAGPSLRRTGAPCTEDEADQCYGGFCLTTDFVAALDPKAEVPGGACSKLGCASDDECGPGAFCLSGIPDLPLPLCLPKCATFADCRYSEGYACFEAEELGDLKACLPASVIALFLCGDGVCDVNEQANPGSCPEDCP